MPSAPRRIRIADDPPAAARAAAGEVATVARASVAARGRFALALSGGSTPQPLFHRLATPPHRDSLPWSRTLIFWADERGVPPEDPRSNFGVARRLLLDRLPEPPRAVRRIRGELPPAEAAAMYEERLVAELGEPPLLDLVLLGLGTDGHTASLFPDGEEIGTDRWAIATQAPDPPHERVSLTLRALNAARSVVFLVTGGRKAEAVARILGSQDEVASAAPGPGTGGTLASAPLSPAARIQPAAPPLWILDAAAAAGLEVG